MTKTQGEGDRKTGGKAVTWPYTSFRTLLNLFERLEAAKAIPPQIDRSFLGGSEGQKTQVLAALRFFGLVDEHGNVTETMRKIVNAPSERPAAIGGLLRQHYPAATKLAADHATTAALEKTFENLGGDTLRKAVAFYLHAAKYANHPVSKFFKAPTGFYAKRKPRSANSPNTPEIIPPVVVAPTDAKSRYIEMLMQKASATTDPEIEKDLLNRIERILQLDGGTGSGDQK